MRRASLCLLALIPTAFAQSVRTDADAAMRQALHYADLYNWADSGPLFAKAEARYRSTGDVRNALYGHIGVIRATMERRSLPRTSEELSRELETNPLLQRDAALRMFCLSVKGDIDGEIDAAPMKKDWEEVRSLAAGFGDAKWKNRATGEIGFAEFMEGQMDAARAHVAGALIQAARTHDVGAQIRYLSAIGTAMVLVRIYEAGQGYLQKALQASAQVPDAGYPFLAKEGNLQALLGLGKIDDARKLAAEIIGEAQSRRKLVKETQARITLARVELAARNPTEAISQLQIAIRLATTGGLPRLLADSEMILVDIYGSQGRLQLAQNMAERAIAVTRKNTEPYVLPTRLTSLAALQVRERRYTDAERTYEQAGYLVDSMLGHVSSTAAKTGLIVAMTDLYVGEFSLLSDDLHRPEKAFAAIEDARGRILRDLLLEGARAQSPQEEAVEGEAWMFLDVVEDGAAFRAGIKPGELLLAIDGYPVRPPGKPMFRMGAKHRLTIGRLGSADSKELEIEVPDRPAKDRPPMIEPKSVASRMLNDDIGYVRVASFPGTVGLQFAAALDGALRDLKERGCKRLIVDLRGNVGGGLGSLRLMSYLCPGKLPIGYSLTRRRLKSGYDREKLPRIASIPASKIQQIGMAIRFKVFQRDRSLALFTEGLGEQPWHDRTVVLINEHTASAAEMVASFVKEHRVATLVGTKTSGQVLGGANFSMPGGYTLRIPVAGWYSPSGACIEGCGISADVPMTMASDVIAAGRDEQLEAACDYLAPEHTVSAAR